MSGFAPDSAAVDWYRQSDRQWIGIVLMVIGGIFGAISVFGPAKHGSPAWPYAVILILAGAALTAAVLRAGIGISASGVIVRSALGRTVVVPWDDVVRFETIDVSAGRGMHSFRVAVVRRDGGKSSSDGCEFGGSPRARRDAEQLTAALEAARAGRPAAQPDPEQTPA